MRDVSYRPNAKFDEPIGGRMPPNAWGQVSPQSRGPSSQGAGHGFGNNLATNGGAMETSSVAVILFYFPCILHACYVMLNEVMKIMANILFSCSSCV